jgi:signal transduction histidine kinase
MDPDDLALAASLLETPPGQRRSAELRLRREGGTACWVLAAAGSMAVHGRGQEVVVMLSDITDHKLAERELQTLRAELEFRVAERTAELAAANAELEAYNYSVAHDLRTPLNGILGFASIMRDDAVEPLPTTHRQRLQMIERSARGMDELIGGLLSLAQLSRQALKVQILDLSSMASHILERLAQAEAGREIRWQVEEDVVATGDRTLVSAVLENLLHNAMKYSRGAPVAEISVGLAECSTAAEPVYEVRDNGIGFDPSTAGKLFTPFNRLPTSRGFEGVGIGLATVRRIVERHGGRIWAESEVHVSTSFYFTLGGAKAPAS